MVSLVAIQDTVNNNFMKKNISKEKLESLINKRLSVREICKELSISKRTLYNRFKEFNLSLLKPLPKFNINIFDIIDSEEKAYWLGFLYADGYVSPRNNQVELSLKSGDYPHLVKFFNFLEDTRTVDFIKISTVKLNDKEYERCRYIIGDKHFHKRLCELGCIPNKSLIVTFPDIKIFKEEDLIFDFIRGYFDGNGSITSSTGGYMRLDLYGTENILLGIRKYFPEFSIPQKDKRENVYYMRSFNKKANLISSQLYKNAKIFLDRKYLKFAELYRDI